MVVSDEAILGHIYKMVHIFYNNNHEPYKLHPLRLLVGVVHYILDHTNYTLEKHRTYKEIHLLCVPFEKPPFLFILFKI
jgi:hypothetical protein